MIGQLLRFHHPITKVVIEGPFRQEKCGGNAEEKLRNVIKVLRNLIKPLRNLINVVRHLITYRKAE